MKRTSWDELFLQKLKEERAELDAIIEKLENSEKYLYVESAPNNCNGDYNCVEFIDDVKLQLHQDKNGQGDEYLVLKNEVPVAWFYQWYENYDLAAESVSPIRETELVWMYE